MKKFSIALLSFLFLFSGYAQEEYIKLPISKSGCPTFIVAKEIIVNESTVLKYKDQITEMSTFLDKPNRTDHSFYNLTAEGIVFFSLNKELTFKTQAELNLFFGINSKNGVYVDGYLIENAEYKIATESIVEIELINPNSKNGLKTKTINVWTITRQERENGCLKSE